jgi:ABC-type branched-subunit amino acid transport system substrate-binding protein
MSGPAWIRAARLAGGTLALLGVASLPMRQAAAQSWLSEAPAAPSSRSSALSTAATVPQLVDLAGKVPARELYPLLRDRVEAELAAVPAQQAGRPAWERKALAALARLADEAGTPAEQERFARAFVDRFPDDDQFPIVFVLLNQALQRQDKPLTTSFFFDQSAQDSLPPQWLTRYLLVQAASADRRGDYTGAAASRLQEYESSRGLRQTQPQDVLDALDRVTDPAGLTQLLAAGDRIGWLREQAPFLKVRALVHAGQLSAALTALEQLEGQSSGLSSVQRKLLTETRTEVRRRVGIRPDRIGVLLPLSSSSAALRELARDTLDGLRMALGAERVPDPVASVTEFDRMPPLEPRRAAPPDGGLEFELVVRDTANDPQTAAKAVETLSQQDGVIAIVGPLARAESEAAAARAEEAGVPLVSLSVSLDIPPGSQFVFRNSKSQEEEVRDLVWYAMDYLRDRRFAILYPANSSGERMLQLFGEEVLRKGGELTAVAPFTPWNANAQGDREAVGLKQIFESFVGQDRPLRPQDRALLEAVGDPKPDAIVDFDALFIPLGQDAAQELRLIAPYPVTVDAEHVQLLGTRSWNDDAVLVAGANKLEGALFPGVYDRSSALPRVTAFQNRHHVLFGHRPRYAAPTYYTAIGYDTLSLLMQQLRDARNRSRESLAHSLKVSAPYPGITGLTAFRPSGEAAKETVFFRIRGNEFVRLQP